MWKEVLGSQRSTDHDGLGRIHRRPPQRRAPGWRVTAGSPTTPIRRRCSTCSRPARDNNTCFYSNAKVDELLNAVDASMDQADRMTKMHEIEQIIMGRQRRLPGVLLRGVRPRPSGNQGRDHLPHRREAVPQRHHRRLNPDSVQAGSANSRPRFIFQWKRHTVSVFT